MKFQHVQEELAAHAFVVTHAVGGSKYTINSLYIDEQHHLWCFHNIKDKAVKIRSFDELLDVQTQEQYDAKTRGGGAGSLLGALTFGVAGAIVGGAISTKTTKQVLKRKSLIVFTTGFDDNTIIINAGSATADLYAAFRSIIHAKGGGTI